MLILLTSLRQAQTNVNVINSINYAEFLNAATSVMRVVPKDKLVAVTVATLVAEGASRRKLAVQQRMRTVDSGQRAPATLRIFKKQKSKVNQYTSGN